MPRVSVDQRNVETPILLSGNGAALTLLNWTGNALPSVNVTAHVSFQVDQVSSVTTGNIAFNQSGDAVSFAMPLQGADIVPLKGPGRLHLGDACARQPLSPCKRSPQ